MAERFSWVVHEYLAGMERPGLFQHLHSDLEFLNNKGIGVIINLEEFFWDYPNFEVLHLPIGDFTPPKQEDFKRFIEFTSLKIDDGKRVLVHCHAGMGRTNVMLASYLVHKEGVKPDAALQEVKKLRPAHWVTEDQEKALWEFFNSL